MNYRIIINRFLVVAFFALTSISSFATHISMEHAKVNAKTFIQNTNITRSAKKVNYIEVVNYIMGNPSIDFVFENADINSDSVINSADIVLIVNKIMTANK